MKFVASSSLAIEIFRNDWYEKAKQYYIQNGNLDVPTEYEDENGHKLGQWISKQRSYYLRTSKRGTITKERIEKLNRIGMVWNVSDYQVVII